MASFDPASMPAPPLTRFACRAPNVLTRRLFGFFVDLLTFFAAIFPLPFRCGSHGLEVLRPPEAGSA